MLYTLTLCLITLLLPAPGLAVSPPGKVQPGSDSSFCGAWARAKAGDSCWSITHAADPPLDQATFFALNPQLQGSCANVWVGYHYCTGRLSEEPRHPEITPPPAPKIACTYDACYNQFEINGRNDPPGVTAMCDAYLKSPGKEADPGKLFAPLPKPSPAYWWPDHITTQCTGDAHKYMSSLCNCYTSAPFTSSLGKGHSI